ncbi:hypothetical protein [Oryzomicrobium sp.]|uniref:hypothetical protein n=1 Tax=Oryzomicrobium sp. TaxID=1911578 RepID=UPI002FDFA3D7
MTTETLMTECGGNQVADPSQAAAPQTEGQQTATGEQTAPQPAAESPATEGTKADGEQDAPQGAPEKYEFAAPEGREFDPKVIEAYSEVAKELNLTQDAAQKLLDKVAPTLEARQQEQFQAIRTKWGDDAKTDKEFGGDKLTESLGVARTALDKFGTPELRTLLNESGLGNHPEVIRFMVRAGKAISEDTFVDGRAPARQRDAASVLYDKSTK